MAKMNSIINAQRPKVSIIIPMYNVEAYVDESVRSVLAQTWQDFEVIVVDDGSTDASLSIVESACNGDQRLRVISQRNYGPGAARNLGLEMSRGEFIYFFDSDDLLESNAIKICITYIQQLKLDLVVFSGEAFSDIPRATERFQQYQKPSILQPQSGQNLFTTLYKLDAYSSSPCLYIFSRTLIESNRLRFDEKYFHEDEAFTLELYCRAKNAISLSDRLFKRRVRLGSIMTKPYTWEHVQGSVQAAVRIENLLTSMNTIKPTTRKILRHHQCILVRRARKTAEEIGQRIIFMILLKKRLKIYSLLQIDLMMALYLYMNPIYYGLKRLGNLLWAIRHQAN